MLSTACGAAQSTLPSDTSVVVSVTGVMDVTQFFILELSENELYSMRASSEDLDAVLTLYSKSNEELAYNDDFILGERNANIYFVPPTTGEYILKVSHLDLWGASSGDTNLRIDAIEPVGLDGEVNVVQGGDELPLVLEVSETFLVNIKGAMLTSESTTFSLRSIEDEGFEMDLEFPGFTTDYSVDIMLDSALYYFYCHNNSELTVSTEVTFSKSKKPKAGAQRRSHKQ